jgi:hypothetical protein
MPGFTAGSSPGGASGGRGASRTGARGGRRGNGAGGCRPASTATRGRARRGLRRAGRAHGARPSAPADLVPGGPRLGVGHRTAVAAVEADEEPPPSGLAGGLEPAEGFIGHGEVEIQHRRRAYEGGVTGRHTSARPSSTSLRSRVCRRAPFLAQSGLGWESKQTMQWTHRLGRWRLRDMSASSGRGVHCRAEASHPRLGGPPGGVGGPEVGHRDSARRGPALLGDAA